MKISITELEVVACHGVLDFEKVNPQKFVFDVCIEVDDVAAYGDDISATVNYAEVCALIEKITKGNVFNLIEKLACECAFAILENFDKAQAVRVKCAKPQAPLAQKFSSIAAETELERVRAYLSLGSSVGDRRGALDKAIKLLGETRGIKVEKVSPYIETPPYGGVAKNAFLNCAARVGTFLPPHKLLDEIHGIEDALGRERGKRWDDRTADIDIIFYGDRRICDERLTVPHPDWENRDFVKIPLAAVALGNIK